MCVCVPGHSVVSDSLQPHEPSHAPVGFLRQEYRSELPFPPLGDLPDPGMEPTSPPLAGGFLTTEPPQKSTMC